MKKSEKVCGLRKWIPRTNWSDFQRVSLLTRRSELKAVASTVPDRGGFLIASTGDGDGVQGPLATSHHVLVLVANRAMCEYGTSFG